jgi:putative ABC transport system permease protein
MPDWQEHVRRHLPPLRAGAAREHEIAAELALHMEQAYAEARARGLNEVEAVRFVEERFANWQQLAREIGSAERPAPEPSRGSIFGGAGQDFRLAFRFLLKNPAFTAIAACTLALGIGANTAIFAMADAIALRGLPYPHPEQLMAIETHWQNQREITAWTSAPDMFDIRLRAHSFSAIAGISPVWNLLLTGNSGADRIEGLFVSANFFPTLGVKPLLGRTFTAAEDDPSRPTNAAVLSYAAWQSRFGGRANALGQTMNLDGGVYTVIGVLPPDFRYVGDPLAGTATGIEIWLPLASNPLIATPRSVRFLKVLGRLKPGVAAQRGLDEIRSIGQALCESYPDANRGMSYDAMPLAVKVAGRVRGAMLLLLAAVGLVLLMACANVASLLLTRSVARGKELAMRVALGASRFRLLRQSLMEGAALAIVGGAAGLALALAGVRVLEGLAPATLTQTYPMRLDRRALLFAAAAVVLAALLAGLPPAWRAARTGIQEVLRPCGRGLTSSHHGSRPVLVVMEVSFALLLLVGAALLVRSASRLLEVNPGFDARNLLAISTQTPPSARTAAQRAAIYQLVHDRLMSVPGVIEVGAVSRLPLMGSNLGTSVAVEGKPTAPLRDVEYRRATPSYFRAMRIPLRAGRWFDEHDGPASLPVALINESMARAFWPDENPVGRRMKLGPNSGVQPWITVIGIVGDVRHFGLDVDPRPEIYVPYANSPLYAPILAIRTAGDPEAIASALAAKVRSVDPAAMPAYDIELMRTLVDRSTAQRRFMMWLLTGFAVAALLLAGVGVYGTVAQAVTQRTQEIGVRLALGAPPAAALRLVFRDGMRLAVAGIAAGAVAAAGTTQFMRTLLFEVQPLDPLAFGAAIAALTGFAALACYLSARRATCVNPAITLRQEG